jgi:hypothetical protein
MEAPSKLCSVLIPSFRVYNIAELVSRGTIRDTAAVKKLHRLLNELESQFEDSVPDSVNARIRTRGCPIPDLDTFFNTGCERHVTAKELNGEDADSVIGSIEQQLKLLNTLGDEVNEALLAVQREGLRYIFLQQACKHFRAAQKTCLLKNVEMRGRCAQPFILWFRLVPTKSVPRG